VRTHHWGVEWRPPDDIEIRNVFLFTDKEWHLAVPKQFWLKPLSWPFK